MYIETERLIITEFTLDMAPVVQANSMDEDNMRFVPDEVWETVEETKEVLEFLISQYGSCEGPFVYPVLLKKSHENIGYVQLCPIEDENWEVGYHIAKQYTGNDYASEAVQSFLPVITKDLGISQVHGICLADNKASIGVMRKCGFENIYTGIGEYQGDQREIIRNLWKNE
ncbi:MAG: GNAT family N-acetyltransferase [Clostridia bacterium]|nr:GNAT family N-acetyltransferase [Clostridia bacterium]